jgi:hypothetical protein
VALARAAGYDNGSTQPNEELMDTHPPATTAPFTDEEWSQLRAEDFAAASAIVILMVSIFSIGVVLYSIVAWAVSS